MVLDPKKFANLMVLSGRPFYSENIAELESNSLQTLTEYSQSTFKQKEEFRRAVCEEVTDSNWKRALLLDEGVSQSRFLQEYYYATPDCKNSAVTKEMILQIFDYRLAKTLPIGFFRGPKLERIRSLYLTGQDLEPPSWRYEWNGRIPDFRNGAARGLSIILGLLLVKFPLLGGLTVGLGFSSGNNEIKKSEIDLQKATSEREINESIEEKERGKTTLFLSVIGLITGFLGILKTTPPILAEELSPSLAKILPFNPAERTTPLPPPPSNPGEEIIPLIVAQRLRDARIIGGNPFNKQLRQTPNFDNPSPATFPSPSPTLVLVGKSRPVSTEPVATLYSGEISSKAASQMENGFLICAVGNTQKIVALQPNVVEVLPSEYLPTAADLLDGEVTRWSNIRVLLDRLGNHVSDASLWNAFIESAVWLVSSFLQSPLKEKMSTSGEGDNSSAGISEDWEEQLRKTEIAIYHELMATHQEVLEQLADDPVWGGNFYLLAEHSSRSVRDFLEDVPNPSEALQTLTKSPILNHFLKIPEVQTNLNEQLRFIAILQLIKIYHKLSFDEEFQTLIAHDLAGAISIFRFLVLRNVNYEGNHHPYILFHPFRLHEKGMSWNDIALLSQFIGENPLGIIELKQFLPIEMILELLKTRKAKVDHFVYETLTRRHKILNKNQCNSGTHREFPHLGIVMKNVPSLVTNMSSDKFVLETLEEIIARVGVNPFCEAIQIVFDSLGTNETVFYTFLKFTEWFGQANIDFIFEQPLLLTHLYRVEILFQSSSGLSGFPISRLALAVQQFTDLTDAATLEIVGLAAKWYREDGYNIFREILEGKISLQNIEGLSKKLQEFKLRIQKDTTQRN